MIGKRRVNNITLKINLVKRNFPEETKNVVGDFSKYINTAGVWACYGIKKDDSKNCWVCLNVGESNDIGTEMRVSRMYSKGIFKNNHEGVYKNYRGDIIFSFIRPKDKPISTRQRVWNDIGEKYKCLYFVIVCVEPDKTERLKIEKEYAKKNQALYWNSAPRQRSL